jgi:hypothetical protein
LAVSQKLSVWIDRAEKPKAGQGWKLLKDRAEKLFAAGPY